MKVQVRSIIQAFYVFMPFCFYLYLMGKSGFYFAPEGLDFLARFYYWYDNGWLRPISLVSMPFKAIWLNPRLWYFYFTFFLLYLGAGIRFRLLNFKLIYYMWLMFLIPLSLYWMHVFFLGISGWFKATWFYLSLFSFHAFFASIFLRNRKQIVVYLHRQGERDAERQREFLNTFFKKSEARNGTEGVAAIVKQLRWTLALFVICGILFCATYWGTYVGYSMFQVPWLLKLLIFYSLVVATYTMEYWWLAFPLYAGYATLCLKYKAFSVRFVQYFWLILLLDIVAWIVSFIVPFGQSTDYVMGRIAYRVHYSQNEFAYTLIMIACVFPSCVLLARLCSFLANFTGAEKRQPGETSFPGGAKDSPSLSSLLTAHASQKEILEKALKWDPENTSLIRTLGKLYFHEGKISAATELFEKITASSQAQPPDYRMLGTLYARSDKFDEKSFPVFQTVLKNEPQLPEFHLYLAKCYFTMKKFDEALEILETTTAVRDAKSLELVADVLFKKGRYDEAEKILSELVENKPSDILLFKHAKALIKRGDLDAAIVLLQKTARVPEYEPESAYYLAQCFLQKELPDIAIRRLQRALELQKNGEHEKYIYYYLGMCWEKKGDAVKAKDMFKKVVLMDFNFKDVKARFEKLAKPDKAWLDEAMTGEINLDINEQAKLRYKILSEIGRGGMGIVYKARDTFLERTVALKVLHDDLNASQNAVKRFITEAKAAAALNHPNIINIYDVGEEKGRKFISMEYIDSGSLRDKIEKGIHDDEIEKILKQVCSALLFAHSKGIIHRDIKPDNVLLTKEGIAKITDFGIAKIHAEAKEIFKTASIVGTPLYISPEQINGEEADVRTDIYSLGALLYEILTGKPPFTRGDIYYQHLHIEPQDPSLQRENVPELLKSIALKCLQKKKEDRFPSVENILKQLAS